MTHVQFGNYTFKTKTENEQKLIWDVVRMKYVVLTPEEWVRQHVLHYLIHDKAYPRTLLSVEKEIELNGLRKRCDVVVFNRAGEATMIIECKTHDEVLNENVFAQIARYNQTLRAKFLWVTNGTLNFCCALQPQLHWLEEVPESVILDT